MIDAECKLAASALERKGNKAFPEEFLGSEDE